MPVTIKGSGGGGVTLDAGAASGSTTLTLPNVNGAVLTNAAAITAAQGGTGLTAVGTSGNVLTSNGTAWTSTAPVASVPAALSTASGSAPSYSARAWASWIANGTISASGNVTSVTNTAAGLYTIAFATAMPDTSYAVVTGSSSTGAANCYPPYYGRDPSTTYVPTAASFVLSVRNSANGASNADYMSAAVFR